MSLKKADLHIHSNYSPDAFSSIREILSQAKKAGLDIIAITDHDTIDGAKEAQKIAQEFGLEVVIGEELNTQQGEIIALFIKESIKPGKPLQETIKEIHSQGGLVVACHPLSFWQEGIGEKVLCQIACEIEAVEIIDAAWTGKRNFKKLQDLNQETLKLASIASSDAHFASLVGIAYTVFEGENSQDLYWAIKNKLTAVEGGFWGRLDYLSYVRYWLWHDIKKWGPLIIFDLIWSARKFSKVFRKFAEKI